MSKTVYFGGTLEHSAKGSERKNHKYTKREWKNGRWVYTYDSVKMDSKGTHGMRTQIETTKGGGNFVRRAYGYTSKDGKTDNWRVTTKYAAPLKAERVSKREQLTSKLKTSVTSLLSSASASISKGKNAVSKAIWRAAGGKYAEEATKYRSEQRTNKVKANKIDNVTPGSKKRNPSNKARPYGAAATLANRKANSAKKKYESSLAGKIDAAKRKLATNKINNQAKTGSLDSRTTWQKLTQSGGRSINTSNSHRYVPRSYRKRKEAEQKRK